MVRSGGGALDNPTQDRFGQMNRKIVLVKSDMIQVTRDNMRERVWENVAIIVHDKCQLAKWPKEIWIRLHPSGTFHQILMTGRWGMVKYSNYVNKNRDKYKYRYKNFLSLVYLQTEIRLACFQKL